MTSSTDVKLPHRPAVFWLIVEKDAGQGEILTLDLDGEGETLPVFCFEEEAEMFLSLGTLGTGWRLERVLVGELKGKLLGACVGVEFVSLDPLPEFIYRRAISLVSVSREQFMVNLDNKAQASLQKVYSPIFPELDFSH